MRHLVLVLSLTALACDQTTPHHSAIFTPTVMPTPTVAPTANVLDGPITATNTGSAFAVSGTVTNRGPLCARAISGHVRFTGVDFAQTLEWALPPAQVVRPGASAPYTACCLPLAISGQTVTYLQFIAQESIACS